MSNTGIRGTIQVIGANVTGCLSFWVAEQMASNNVWGQVGYFLCDTNGVTPTAFYQVWNSGGVAAGGSTSVSTGPHVFSMYVQSGTTWAYAVDGSVFGTVIMNSTASSSSLPIEALSEEGYVSGPYNPPEVETSAIQVLKSGNWHSPVNGYEPYGCGTTASCWGVAGNLQNSTIPADAIVVGGNTALVNSGTWLWNSGSPDFSITANPTNLAIYASATGTSTISVSPINGFTGTVTLAVTTNSTGLTCSLSSSSIAGGSGTSTLSCHGSPAGNYAATVTGTSGTLKHSVSVVFHIQDFTITANPTSTSVNIDSQGTSTITIAPTNGFLGTVTLTLATNSTSLSCTLSPGSITGGSGTSTLSCTGSTIGDYQATVSGTSGTSSHTVTVTYRVQDFVAAANPKDLTLGLGAVGNSTVTISSVNGFAGTVSLAVATNSTNLSCGLSSTSIPGGSGSSTLSCSSSVAGGYLATVTATSGGLSHSAAVTFQITSSPDFYITANPSLLIQDSGVSSTSTVNVFAVNGFTGTVVLMVTENSTNLSCTLSSGSLGGGSGYSTLSCTGQVVGNYEATVTGTSGSLSHFVFVDFEAQDFTVSANPSSFSFVVGGSGSSVVTITSGNGFGGVVGLTLSMSPSGLSCALNPASLAGSGSSTLTCQGNASGLFTVTVTASSGPLTHSTSVTVTVNSQPGFTITLSSSSVTVPAGGKGNSTITVNGVNGFTGTVSLTYSVSPGAGLTCTLSPNTVPSGSGASTLSCSGSGGAYTVTVTGTSGSLSQSASVAYYQAGLFLLQVNTASAGVIVTIDGQDWTTNSSGRVSTWVTNGTHTIIVPSTIPMRIGSVALPIGVVSTFDGWDNRAANNPLTINVTQDEILTATYKTTIQTSFYELTVGVSVLTLLLVFAFRRRRGHSEENALLDGSA